MPFRLFDHTADVGVEGTGSDAGSALASAGTALAAVLSGLDDPRTLRPAAELVFTVEAPDREALAVAFLSELIWRWETDGLLWTAGGTQIEQSDLWRATARGNAARLDATRASGVEVKAVTYHGLEFAKGRHGWRVRVILDL